MRSTLIGATSQAGPAPMETATNRAALFTAHNGRWLLAEYAVLDDGIEVRSATDGPTQAGMEDVIEAATVGSR